MKARVPFLLVAAVLAGVAAASGYRIYELERSELEQVTPPRTLRTLMAGPHASRVSARVTSVQLRAGDRALFELCARDGLRDAPWRDAVDFAVIALDQKKLLLRVPLDAAHLAHVERSKSAGCLLLGSGTIETAGAYSVEAVWLKAAPPDALLDVDLTLRVVAKPPILQSDRVLLLSVALAVLFFLGATAFRNQPAEPSAEQQSSAHWVGTACAVVLLFAATQLPLFGSTLTFVKGMLLLALQCGVAWMLGKRLSSRGSRQGLALLRPARPAAALVMAVVAWPMLVFGARLALRVVPSSGEAPIETFVSWPSGMMSAALLGVLLPVGEELFFRGYVYGALLPAGRFVAALVSVAAFASLHAQQSWGQWGALLAVSFAGVVFTALRIFSGSTLVPVLTHVAYNLALSLGSLQAASALLAGVALR